VIVEPKPKQDPIEDVLMASLEDMAQPVLNDEHLIQQEEELAEHIELDQTEVPSQPLIELKSLPSGLKYVFLNNNRETPVIISDKLSQEETHKLVAVLERHKSAICYSLQDLIGLVLLSVLNVSLSIPILHLQRSHNGDLTTLCERLLRKRSLSFCTMGLFIPCLIVSGLALSKLCQRKEV
jgi:hypothetical protein